MMEILAQLTPDTMPTKPLSLAEQSMFWLGYEAEKSRKFDRDCDLCTGKYDAIIRENPASAMSRMTFCEAHQRTFERGED